jgi:hypothetical protein
MRIGKILWIMSFAKKFVPKGLKLLEYKRGVGGKVSPIHYIPEKDPVQEALVRNKKINYFKLTLPHTGSKPKVTLWVSWKVHGYLLYNTFFARLRAKKKDSPRYLFFSLQMRTVRLTRIADADGPKITDSGCGYAEQCG